MLDVELDKELSLRLLEDWHAKELYELIDRNREHLHPWFSWVDQVHSENDAKALINSSIKDGTNQNFFENGIWFEKKLIGVIGFNKIDWDNYKAVLNYWIAEEHEGQGFMTEAIKGMICYAFNDLNLHKVEILCPMSNERACHLPKKLGFKGEGVLKEEELINGQFVDMIVFSLLASDLKAKQVA